MIKYSNIIKRLKEKKSSLSNTKKSNLSRKGSGYLKRRLGILSSDAPSSVDTKK